MKVVFKNKEKEISSLKGSLKKKEEERAQVTSKFDSLALGKSLVVKSSVSKAPIIDNNGNKIVKRKADADVDDPSRKNVKKKKARVGTEKEVKTDLSMSY